MSRSILCIVTNEFQCLWSAKACWAAVHCVYSYVSSHFFSWKAFQKYVMTAFGRILYSCINNCIGLCFWDVVTEMSWLDLNGGLAVSGSEYVPVNDRFCVSDAVMSYFTLLLKLRRWNWKLDEVCLPNISCYIAHCPGFLVF